MHKATLWTSLFAATLLFLAGFASAFPEPSIVSKTWEFDIEVGEPRPVSMRDERGQLQWYWYLPYKVQNNTGRERLFIPEFDIATDEGDIVAAGQDVPAKVFDLIKEKEGNTLLLSPIEIVGRMLVGRDFAKESVAIWPAFDHSVDQVDVFVAGLSGETQQIEHPLTKDPVIMRKVLMYKYATPGDVTHPQKQSILPRGEEWIMR